MLLIYKHNFLISKLQRSHGGTRQKNDVTHWQNGTKNCTHLTVDKSESVVCAGARIEVEPFAGVQYHATIIHHM